jgi:hypothetical protein
VTTEPLELLAVVGVILALFILAGAIVAMLRGRSSKVITAALAGVAGLLVVLPRVLQAFTS